MQYAIIKSGGKQHWVRPGDICRLEKLPDEAGAEVRFDQVLMVSEAGDDSTLTNIGQPYIDGGCVTGTVIGHGRAAKIELVRYKRRKKYRRRQGHRQHFTEVRIDAISS